MHTLDQRLADWTAAYSRLKDAQEKLNSFGTRATLAMKEDVAKHQREAERALAEMQKEFELFRKRQSTATKL